MLTSVWVEVGKGLGLLFSAGIYSFLSIPSISADSNSEGQFAIMGKKKTWELRVNL